MKINIILPFTALTGGIKIAFEYSDRLKKRGHDVIIYVPMKAYKFNNHGISGKLKTLKASIGNTLKRGNKVDWFDLKTEIRLVPLIKDRYIRDADVVVATAWPTAFDVDKLHISKGKKFYLVQHYEIWSGPLENVDNSYRLPLNKIVIAKWLQDLMQEKFGQKSNLIYNGIDLNEFKYDRNAHNSNEIIVSMLYHTLEWKGFEDGLKAFELAKEKYPYLKLKLFGTEKGNNVPEYAEFYCNPSKEELKDIYNKSDIFIFPSKKEGWGLTVLEAMACKCAVVGTDTGALNEIGVHGENALISDTNDIEMLSKNIINLVEDSNLRKKISENGYLTAYNLDWEKSIDKIEKLFFLSQDN